MLNQQIELDDFSQKQSINHIKNGDYQPLSKINQDSTFVPNYLQTKTQITHSSYRPDIDGLRTIAVGIVVYFHAFPDIMTGGFIGVDVFFVISGYLISGIIIKQIQKDNFYYSDFYSRRIKRIYPALLLVLTTVLLFGYMEMFGRQLQIMTNTLAAATVFGANLQILTYEKGYFDADVKRNPLLHLWSLGVEEQFYIIWPLFLYFILKKNQHKRLSLFILFTIVSFVFSIIALQKSQKFAFYFPLCRFWQMAIGGLIAYKTIDINSMFIKNTLSIVGTSAILISVWIVNQDSMFPGFWAIIPTISAAFMIIAGNEAIINHYILSSRPIVFIGKISYALYLWHWPLLAFMRMQYPHGSNSMFSKSQTMIVIALILSILTYYLVQNPLRFGKSKKIVWFLAIAMIILGLFAFFISKKPQFFTDFQQFQKVNEKDMIPGEDDFYFMNGRKLINSSKNKKRLPLTKQKLKVSLKPLHHRIFDQVNQTSKYFDPFIQNNAHFFEILNQGRKNTLFIIGDSHGEYIRPRFLKLYQESVENQQNLSFPTVLSITKCGMPFTTCSNLYNYTIEYIKKHKPNRVLFKNRWSAWFRWGDRNGPLHKFSSCEQQFKNSKVQSYQDVAESFRILAQTLKEIIDIGTEVYVATVSPQGDAYDPRQMMNFFGIVQSNVKPIKLSQFKNENKQFIDLFEGTLSKVGVKFIDYSEHQCWNDICEVLTPKGYSLYIDDNHFRYIYSKYWASSVDFLVQF